MQSPKNVIYERSLCHCEERSDKAIFLSNPYMSLLRLGSQLRLRGVYTEQSECARNDNFLITFTIIEKSLD